MSYVRQFSMIHQRIIDEFLMQDDGSQKVVTCYGEERPEIKDIFFKSWTEEKMKIYLYLNNKRFKHHSINIDFIKLFAECGLLDDVLLSFGYNSSQSDILWKYRHENLFRLNVLNLQKNFFELCLQGHLAIRTPVSPLMEESESYMYEDEKVPQTEIYLMTYREGKDESIFKNTRFLPQQELQEWRKNWKTEILDRYLEIKNLIEQYENLEFTNRVFDKAQVDMCDRTNDVFEKIPEWIAKDDEQESFNEVFDSENLKKRRFNHAI